MSKNTRSCNRSIIVGGAYPFSAYMFAVLSAGYIAFSQGNNPALFCFAILVFLGGFQAIYGFLNITKINDIELTSDLLFEDTVGNISFVSKQMLFGTCVIGKTMFANFNGDTAKFKFIPEKRGYFTFDFFSYCTSFPLGIFRCGVRFKKKSIVEVFPKPVEHIKNHNQGGGETEIGVSQYSPGDSPKRILWKKFASNNKLLVKTEENVKSGKLVFSMNLPLEHEKKLQQLCYLCLDAEKRGVPYRLLTNSDSGESVGKEHLLLCLRMLNKA